VSSLLPFPTPAAHFYCETWLTCHSTAGTRYTFRVRADSLLATEHPLSVIPLPIQHQLDVAVKPARGWKGHVPSWFGISCRIGRVSWWLPTQEGPGSYREFSLLAMRPQTELEDAAPFLYLGTQFLLEYQAQIHIDGSSLAAGGRLVIP
jgi:hypothetical protein